MKTLKFILYLMTLFIKLGKFSASRPDQLFDIITDHHNDRSNTSPLRYSSLCSLPNSVLCSSKSPRLKTICKVEHVCMETKGELVQLAMYYESLCPDCQQFFKLQLWDAYQKIGGIFNLTLIPFGNAMENKSGSKWIFNCQHGEDECIGNLIETCAINLLADRDVWLPFINCIEVSQELPKISAPKCAVKHKVNYKSIEKCVNGKMGNQMEHQMAKLTEQLKPPHQYVPWITLQGEHTEDIQHQAETDLIKLICDTFKGEKPSGCTKLRMCLRGI